MNALTSYSTGLLFFPQERGRDEYVDLPSGEKIDLATMRFSYPIVDEWQEIQGNNKEEIFETAHQGFWLERSTSLIQSLMRGLNTKLELKVLDHAEEILLERVDPKDVLDRLLVAPLKPSLNIDRITDVAMSNGYTAVGSIMDELDELQPLINRFSDVWLRIEDSHFSDIEMPKNEIWRFIVYKGNFSEILKSKTSKEFSSSWGKLFFEIENTQSRIALNKLQKILSREFYADLGVKEKDITKLVNENIDKDSFGYKTTLESHEAYENVGKQIQAILEAVESGKQSKADKFLRELVNDQIANPGGEEFAIKSLCNIAKRSAEMLRYDFEKKCLEKALKISKDDQWTLIQYGDHLKRLQKYEEAIEVLNKAKDIKYNSVALSAIGDVYSDKGEYIKAIQYYKNIDEWEDSTTIQNAIADIKRKMGRFKESREIYIKLLKSSHKGFSKENIETEVRAKVGLAEIAKQKGEFEIAKAIYKNVIDKDLENNDSRLFYELGYSNVLKLNEDYDKALEVVDNIVQNYPFALQAKFTRGSILGLISREEEGLESLEGSASWNSWLQYYYRGLILLKMDRFDQARENLVEKLNDVLATGEEKNVMRLGAAYWFIKNGNSDLASDQLNQISEEYSQTKYLSYVLELHLAALKKDEDKVKRLKATLENSDIIDVRIKKAIRAIVERKFEIALDYEMQALLKVAA